MAVCDHRPEKHKLEPHEPYCVLEVGHEGDHSYRSTRFDHPFHKVVDDAFDLIQKKKTAKFYQKFTCQGCGNRLGMDEPNRFYMTGTCDQCGAVTDIESTGTNFILIAEMRELTDEIKEMARQHPDG